MMNKRGLLSVRYGPMGAGKTTWLIKQFKPGVTKIFVPNIDHRSGEALKSHDGLVFKQAVVVVPHDQPEAIYKAIDKQTQRVLIDETNFWSEDLVGVVTMLRQKGIDVFAVGLLLDTDRKDFGPTRELLGLADQATALFARCDETDCDQPAEFNYFKGQKPGQVVVGAFDLYGCACKIHYPILKQYYRTNNDRDRGQSTGRDI